MVLYSREPRTECLRLYIEYCLIGTTISNEINKIIIFNKNKPLSVGLFPPNRPTAMHCVMVRLEKERAEAHSPASAGEKEQ